MEIPMNANLRRHFKSGAITALITALITITLVSVFYWPVLFLSILILASIFCLYITIYDGLEDNSDQTKGHYH